MMKVNAMIRRLMRQNTLVVLGTTTSLLLIGAGQSEAQNRPTETKSIEGRVKSLTTAPKGEIDGAVLEDGTVLHWPPHLQDRFTAIVLEGARVRATGRSETGPEGDTRVEIETVTNTQSNRTATNTDFDAGPPHGPAGPHGPGRRPPPPPARKADAKRSEMETMTGTVRKMTTAPRGEIDGALLDDGTALHWPPHLQDRFTMIVKVGNQIRVKGRRQTAPRGEVSFEVQSATDLRNNQSVENPDSDGPAGVEPIRNEPGPRRDQRIEELQRQIDQIQRELDRLRRGE